MYSRPPHSSRLPPQLRPRHRPPRVSREHLQHCELRADQSHHPPYCVFFRAESTVATPNRGTHDIIGGNFGSPVVNMAGGFVGIIFDGNVHSLVGDFGYEDRQSHALSVHSAGILEALKKVYEVPALVAELANGRR